MTNATGDAANDTVGTVADETTDGQVDGAGDAVNGTGETVDETVDTVTAVANETSSTVENATATTGDAVDDATDDLTDVTGNESETLVDLDVNATANASVGVAVGGATSGAGWTVRLDGDGSTDGRVAGTVVGSSSEPASTPPEGTSSDPIGRPWTDANPSATAANVSVTAANASSTAANESAMGANGAGANGRVSNGAGSSSGPASPGGAAVGGALIVAAVGTAAAAKHVGATTAAAQGEELLWTARSVQLRAATTVTGVKQRLARVPELVLPFGYSRHDDSDPLEHAVRQSLFETVERSPGVNLSTLADGVDVSLSSVRHHLRIMEEEHLVVSERIRGQRRYFPRNEANPELVAALDDPATASILTTLATHGPTSVSDLAERLGRDPSTISHHVSRLEDDGLIERERDGRTVLNDLAPAASRVMTQGSATRRPVATE